MVKSLTCLICFTLLAANLSSGSEGDSIEVFPFREWVGVWIKETKERTTTETWVFSGSHSLRGSSTVAGSNGNIVFKEYLSLIRLGEIYYYIAKVPSNDYPVPFKLVEVEKARWVFENLDHDFPNRIVYEMVNDDQLLVRVSGTNGDGFSVRYERSVE